MENVKFGKKKKNFMNGLSLLPVLVYPFPQAEVEPTRLC